MTPSDIEKSIEIWRIQFEKTQDSEYLGRFPSGNYQWSFIEERFAGFVIAMKSLVVELPAEIVEAIEALRNNVRNSGQGVIFSGLRDNDQVRSAIDMLLRAGINYRERE